MSTVTVVGFIRWLWHGIISMYKYMYVCDFDLLNTSAGLIRLILCVFKRVQYCMCVLGRQWGTGVLVIRLAVGSSSLALGMVKLCLGSEI